MGWHKYQYLILPGALGWAVGILALFTWGERVAIPIGIAATVLFLFIADMFKRNSAQ